MKLKKRVEALEKYNALNSGSDRRFAREWYMEAQDKRTYERAERLIDARTERINAKVKKITTLAVTGVVMASVAGVIAILGLIFALL